MSGLRDLNETTAAYLARLGLVPEPPSAEALFRLHRSHVERIPYETLWIHLGELWDIDPWRSMERVAHRGRGGYCFHLNGAFSELLRALGYRVVRHQGGVHGPGGPAAADMGNHLALTVHGLPSYGNPDGDWLVDVGLGDALYEPIPLRAGAWRQGPLRLGLEAHLGNAGDWRLVHDPAGTFHGMAWRQEPASMTMFAGHHQRLSTSPESGFVRLLTIQRRDATGTSLLRGLTFRRTGASPVTITLSTLGELRDLVQGSFGLDLPDVEPAAWAALWSRLHQAHEAWLAANPS